MQAVSELPPVGPDASRLYLVRHGTTRLNTENRYRGRLNVPLDQQGWEDAHAAGQALKDLGLAAIYSSPLDRARDTARLIASYAGLSTVEDLPGLVNLDYGRWEGLTVRGAAALDPRAFLLYRNRPEHAVCPGGEALSDATVRMLQTLAFMGHRHRGEVVCGVSHAVMIRLAVARLLGLRGAEWRVPVGIGSVTVFEVVDAEVSVVNWPDAPSQPAQPAPVERLPGGVTDEGS